MQDAEIATLRTAFCGRAESELAFQAARYSSFGAMISLTEARRILSDSVNPRPSVPTPLAEARGKVLSDAAVADADYPSGDRSMMDGYVIPADAGPGTFRVVGEIQAGQIPERALQSGEAMRIYTGALLPEGGGRVVMQEEARRDGETVTFENISERRFVREKGSEARPGDVVLPTGTRLGAAELAILAQIGAVAPRVVRPPMIHHIATGGEIVAPSEVPQPGQIRDTNSTLLAALVAGMGIGSTIAESHRGIDDPAVLAELGNHPCDLLLISGGASVGDYDFGAETLRRLGFTIHFDRINLRPGKPLTFATRDDQAAFVVPGNPVSHFVCFHVAIRLAIERMAGVAPAWDFLHLEVRGGAPMRPDPRETFWPARAFVEDGRLVVTPKRWSTSGDTFSLAGTNALVRMGGELPSDGRVETLLI